MNAYTMLFMALVLLEVTARIGLSLRHIRHVAAHRDEVPSPFRHNIALEAHQKAADYTIARVRIGLLDLTVGSLLLVVWTLGGGLEWLDHLWRAQGLSEPLTGTGFLLSAVLLMAVLELPLSAWRTFGIERRFGFNRTTPMTFLGDALKAGLLMALLGGPLAWLALTVMVNAGTFWWFWVWALWLGFTLLVTWAFPTFIAPLFNRFAPLEDPELRDRIEALLERCGFHIDGIYVVDGSRRSSHGNAYFTGLGRTKRIVFYDTLLDQLAADEVEAVLAHELGHCCHHHVRKRLLLGGVVSLVGLAALGWLVGQPAFFTGLGISQPSPHAALILFMMVTPLLGLFLQPVSSWVSRRHEFEADDFATRETGARPLVEALVKLYRDNASTLTPDPLYSAFHDSHPPAPVRIAHLSSKMVG